MIVKTKKYKLETGTYIKIGLLNILKEQWWVSIIYLVICAMYFVIPSWWWIIGATIGLVLYLLFWLIQFAGIPQLEQNKILFEKLGYEIDSRQILVKVSNKQGMPISWDMVKRAQIGKKDFVLVVTKAQIIHLPYRIFNNDNQVKFVETILKRKGLIK
ncbi:MAG: hypothetical protein DHS20C17_20810 [Cyclobacteriaceae bacterium]|nr:MAG: hypothetical protein DHS20C17_20810 [Cyclobacteriaceae bacterium]